MARVHLVRHGRATAGWGEDPDPGLDDVGRAQAAAMADRLAPLGPLHLFTSPLRRARETAAPLAARWGVEPVVEPAVGEIVAPVDDLASRAAWLAVALAGTWPAQPPASRSWRDRLVATLVALPHDTVVVTHFVAVNVAVGAATGDDRVTCCHPANASVTVLDAGAGRLRLVALGDEADTVVT